MCNGYHCNGTLIKVHTVSNALSEFQMRDAGGNNGEVLAAEAACHREFLIEQPAALALAMLCGDGRMVRDLCIGTCVSVKSCLCAHLFTQ